MDVNKAELRKIANDADASRKTRERQRKNEERERVSQERRAAGQKADKILASIPEALKKAAPDARRTSTTKGRVVVARIPVVHECMTSIMANAGNLDEEDKRILRAVRKKFKSLRIDGVELKLKYETKQGSFGSADGLDDADGPCKYYYIEAKTVID